MKRIAAVLVIPCLLAAGCSIKSKAPNAYHLAQQACASTGQTALSYAQQAAKLDPQHFTQLATDEAALLANVNAQQSQPTGEEDLGNLAGITGQEGTGTGSSDQVLVDCKNIELQLLPGQ